MKIHIWINKTEAVSGKITKWYTFGPPQSSNWPDYVQTSENTTYPEFVEKHYTPERDDDWLVEQYNRNRPQEEWVKTRDEIPYIYERDGENVYRRRMGDKDRELLTNEEFHASKKPIKRDLKKLVQELQTISGAKFADWWRGLSKDEQIELTKFWE